MSHSGNNFGENRPKIVIYQYRLILCGYYTMCILCVNTSHYDLSVLSLSVMGFQKKFGYGWLGGVSYIKLFGTFFIFAKKLMLLLCLIQKTVV